MGLSLQDIAYMIDHSLLRPQLTTEEFVADASRAGSTATETIMEEAKKRELEGEL